MSVRADGFYAARFLNASSVRSQTISLHRLYGSHRLRRDPGDRSESPRLVIRKTYFSPYKNSRKTGFRLALQEVDAWMRDYYDEHV